MKLWILRILTIVVALIVILPACTPPMVPQPTPISTPQAVPPPSVPASPALSAEDSAWEKVAEAARKEGTLTVYSVHLVGDVATKVIQAFNKRTGLRVEIVSGPSATALERVKTERRAGSQIGSVMTGNASMFLAAKADGLNQSIGYLPELKKKIPEGIRFEPLVDKEGHVLAFAANTGSVWVNTNLVRPGTEPRSWRDLLKPEWKGKIAMGDPNLMPTANQIYVPLTNRGLLDDAYFRALGKQELQFQSSSRMDFAALSRGQALLTFGGSAPSAGPFVAEGAPIKAIDMAEGVVTIRSSVVALVQGAPHPNAGRLFLNWLYSPEGQTIVLGTIGLMGFRKDVPDFEPPQARFDPTNRIIATPEEEVQIGEVQRAGMLKKLLMEGAK